MSRPFIAFLAVLAFLVGGVVFYQYRFYRSPIQMTESSERTIITSTQKDAIPAIVEAEFESVGAADVYLNNDGYGLVVHVGSRTRFYPFQILVWHEVVHDEIQGVPLLVSFDPLTYTAGVYKREEGSLFGVSGRKWNNNTLLYDLATSSLWSQMKGTAIEGERLGETLERYPSNIVAWTTFKQTYPLGSVLSRDTGVERDYTQNPYDGYEETAEIWFLLDHEDARLPAKSLVYGVERDGVAIAFPVDNIEEFDTIQTIVGEDVVLQPAYWFAWAAMHPGTDIYSLQQ